MNRRSAASFIINAALVIAAPAIGLAHDGVHPEAAGQAQKYGQSGVLGTGTLRTYTTLASDKDPATNRRPPIEMGVEIPANVLYGLPAQDAVVILDFPIQARDTPFQYMMIDWNAHGHEPAGIYDLPHFDFHFYIQDLQEVAEINPGTCSGLDCDDFAKAMKPVPSQYVPGGYLNLGSVVPFMGNHLIDLSSPEFNGKTFTRTFIYGAYDGQITFYEPMITYDALSQKQEQCTAIKQPQSVAIAGYYPAEYCTRYNAETSTYTMFLTDFSYRTAK